MQLTVIARNMNGRYWLGGIVAKRGDPFIVDCGHKHEDKSEALDCAEHLFHADEGSITQERLAKAELSTRQEWLDYIRRSPS